MQNSRSDVPSTDTYTDLFRPLAVATATAADTRKWTDLTISILYATDDDCHKSYDLSHSLFHEGVAYSKRRDGCHPPTLLRNIGIVSCIFPYNIGMCLSLDDCCVVLLFMDDRYAIIIA